MMKEQTSLVGTSLISTTMICNESNNSRLLHPKTSPIASTCACCTTLTLGSAISVVTVVGHAGAALIIIAMAPALLNGRNREEAEVIAATIFTQALID